MTRDEVIQMAVEVGGIDKPEPDSPGVVFLERFAAMVAKAERERAQQIVDGMKTELQTLLEKTYLEGAIAAVNAERAACEAIAEKELGNTAMLTSLPPQSAAAWNILAAIRARGIP